MRGGCDLGMPRSARSYPMGMRHCERGREACNKQRKREREGSPSHPSLGTFIYDDVRKEARGEGVNQNVTLVTRRAE